MTSNGLVSSFKLAIFQKFCGDASASKSNLHYTHGITRQSMKRVLGPSLWLSAWATQLQRNVAAAVSCRGCVQFGQ